MHPPLRSLLVLMECHMHVTFSLTFIQDVEDWRLKMVVRLIRSKNNSIKDKVIQNAIRGSYHVQL